MGTLFDEVRGEQNIFSAWRHVKRSALKSSNPEIRGYASEFEHTHQRHLHRIIKQLRENRFTFDPVEGVLKDRRRRQAQGKDPRPIAIGSIKNRLVQRAILQVLQPRETRDPRKIDPRYETKRDLRLGRIDEVNHSRFGVGGLIYPYGGVRPAIELILQAMRKGAKYYYQSDIKSFFTHIPTASVVDFVRLETGDLKLTEIFQRALDFHLANKDELQGYAELFPRNGIGVAQGSSLSAFAGNVILFDFDHQLNELGISAVRYIDDILIVSPSEAKLDEAIAFAKSALSKFKFDLYDPNTGSEKASRGMCKDAINFLGCSIQPNRCVPSRNSVDKMKKTITESLSESKSAIIKAIKQDADLDSNFAKSSVLQNLGKKIFGWQRSFALCTEAQPFRQLDVFIAEQILQYDSFIHRHVSRAPVPLKMAILGIPSTEDLFKINQTAPTEAL